MIVSFVHIVLFFFFILLFISVSYPLSLPVYLSMYSAFLSLKELIDMVVMVEVVMMRSQILSTLSMECMKGEYTVALPDGRASM